MTKSNQSGPAPGPAGGGSKVVVGVVLLAVLAAAVAAVIIPQMRSRERAKPPESGGVDSPLASPSSAARGSERVAGRWYRADGGYVLDLKLGEGGRWTANYFNPQPIKVSKTEVTREGSLTKVVVELNDTGYPGCVYTLLFDEPKDVLRGTYFQAAMGQTYEISFERVKE